ncbi:type I polyketide synthase [Vitiosangium sp. GDMCC 1.1324]|uniref:type I polyketide synthase n=1 Tax=Vitiosangium sp. (strain GDMCC 1.1324) TaxID=2138576 RepID=UPI000D39066F|nr:type I polyketide synthase [Vitiosangium sp. GDMCC 1.1324]PTL74996.1 6-deoxyerythronolide-B synthase [Vitiosangium sp. GDMCC 1.1324]
MTEHHDTSTPDPSLEMAIAIVGLSVRVPGARDSRQFWSNLVSGVESISIQPSADGLVAAAGVLDGAECFDAPFFGYSPSEAEQMDPQHRLFLECAWSALESAGYAPRGRPMRAGVYAGASFSTYLLSSVLPDAQRSGRSLGESLFGCSGNFLATRIAYELDLTGPSLTVQTACSTSLVAVHLACQALLSRECELALAGGVSIRVPQLSPYRFQEGGILSPDGHCRPFDVRAAGTVGGNGAGVVVLKRLADALADRDPIRAVILGTAINNDGSSKTGFSAPSVPGQAAVISEAQAVAGVDPHSISYIEAHGTGTPLGDPIEVAALKQVFREVSPGSCGLGSVKSNIGHLDVAAGVTGLIKAVLAVENRTLPPTLHFTAPNPQLGLEGSPFYVVSRPALWAGPAPLRAGVSSFGIGGTNAHAVLEEAPSVPSDPPRRDEELLLLSAKSEAALDRMTTELAEHLGAAGSERLADVAHTLQTGRARFSWRRFVIGSRPEETAALLSRRDSERVRTGLDEAERRGAVFLFPGGGSQRVNMGTAFLREPAFREALDRCAGLMRGPLGGDLREVMFAGPERVDAATRELDRPLWVQSALFACDWAMAQLWLSWGVQPEALLGHSLGEYVAACLAGVFTLEEACSLMAVRARMAEQMPPGAMVSVLAPVEEVSELLGPALSVAAINGPSTCVLSGPPDAIESLEKVLAAREISFKRVRYARAAHSAMLDPYLSDFARAVDRVKLRPPKLPLLSSATGRWLSEREATDPTYWVRHLRDTVRFSDALSLLLATGERALIEVGPGSTLGSFARQHPARTSQPVIATLPGGASQPASALAPLGEAWLAGVPIDWERFRAGEHRRRVALPTYSFDRERYWIEPAAPGAPASTAPGERRPSPRPSVSARSPRKGGPPAPARNETERALVECFRELFRIEEIGIQDDFFALGGDSLMGLRLTALISQHLGVRLPLKVLVESPTIAALAEKLGGTRETVAPARASCLVRLQEGERGPPLFFPHAAGGQTFFYRELARLIDPSRPAYGFESPVLEDGGPTLATVEEMAAHYLELLRTVQPSGPYLLVGASFGGMLAYEMGRRLSAEGHAVPLCALLDSPGPGRLPAPPANDAELLAVARVGGDTGFSDPEQGRRLLRAWRVNLGAMFQYPAPRWEAGELQFFRAAELIPSLPDHLELGWIDRCSAVRVEVVPGNHESMLLPPHAEGLAARIRACLERAHV